MYNQNIETFLEIVQTLNNSISILEYSPPVSYVYNPTIYAKDMYDKYIRKYCNTTKDILFVGLNPEPNGMCQTGIPLGDVDSVKDWLKVSDDTPPNILQPAVVCEDRPITGMNCLKKEANGERFWRTFENLSKTPDVFFNNAFLYNYCPLQIMKEDGSIITLDALKKINPSQYQEIIRHCDEALIQILNLLEVKKVIAIGGPAQKKVIRIIKSNLITVEVLLLVKFKKRWTHDAKKFIENHQLTQYFIPNPEVLETIET